MMKIYFCGSIHGGRQDADLYRILVDHLETYGQVLTEHVADTKLNVDVDADSKFIHDRDLEWLAEADLVVAEVTQPSLGVGYEIGRAVVMKKPILCMFRPDSDKRLSCMIDGAQDGKDFVVRRYKESEGTKVITEFMEKFKAKITEDLDN